MNIVQKYYRRTLNYSSTRFILETAFFTIILKLFISLTLGTISLFLPDILQFDPNFNTNNDYQDYLFLVIFFGIVAPFFETFSQWIPIWALEKITTNYLAIIIFTGMLFAAFHISYSIPYSIIMIPLGIALAWSFYCKNKRSIREAFFITFAIHSTHNLASILISFV